MTIALAIIAVWLALNAFILVGLTPRISRDDRRWMVLHPGMPLHRRRA